MTRQRRRVTSGDVARAVGVSEATVSYVVNNAPNVSISDGTRRRVLEAAKRLGYTPYGPARTLASGRSQFVIFVMPDWPLSHRISVLLDQVEAGLAAQGLALVVHRYGRSGERVADVWKAIGPHGVIGFEAFTAAEGAAMSRAGIRVSQVVLEGDGAAAGVVVMPQRGYGETQVRHLAATGHRRLGYAYPIDERVAVYARLRSEGAFGACRDLGLPQPVVQRVRPDLETTTAAVRGWLEGPEPVTAVCTYNDQIAFATVAAIRRLGLRIPDDLAVVGADGDPAAEFCAPPLTTVCFDLEPVARYLVAGVLDPAPGEELVGPAPPLDLPLRLVVRETAP